jgi:hypothetical protein
VLDDAAVHVGAKRLGGRGGEGVAGVHPDPAGAAVDRLGHLGRPLVGQVLGIDLDRGRVLREDRGAELAGEVGRLAAQDRLAAPGGHGPDLGQLAVPLGLHGVGRFPFGRHLPGVLGELLGRQVAALGGGPGQDLIGGGPCGAPLVA